jgi:AcrR family transcriptional regulator
MTQNRAPLDQDAIVAAAVSIADRDGVDAVTMRNLADRLGYKVMSLYNHVANKDELLMAMVDTVATEIEGPDADIPPIAAVREQAIRFRAALVAHPWAPGIWNRHVPGPARTVQMERLLATLAASGLPDDLAHHGFHAVINHVLGYTLQEQTMAVDHRYTEDPEGVARDFVGALSPDDFPHTIAHVHQHLDGETESSFEIVLDLILDGLVGLAERR